MKIGPGVDLSLPAFHSGDGLFVQPQPDGRVRVMSTNGEAPLATGQNLRSDHTLDAEDWEMAAALRGAQPLYPPDHLG